MLCKQVTSVGGGDEAKEAEDALIEDALKRFDIVPPRKSRPRIEVGVGRSLVVAPRCMLPFVLPFLLVRLARVGRLSDTHVLIFRVCLTHFPFPVCVDPSLPSRLGLARLLRELPQERPCGARAWRGQVSLACSREEMPVLMCV